LKFTAKEKGIFKKHMSQNRHIMTSISIDRGIERALARQIRVYIGDTHLTYE
jgi:hypothetical protein